jgi:hypothetical protein
MSLWLLGEGDQFLSAAQRGDWLVKGFSYEEKIHMLFAQRLESGPRNFIPSSGQPTWDSVSVMSQVVARGFVG